MSVLVLVLVVVLSWCLGAFSQQPAVVIWLGYAPSAGRKKKKKLSACRGEGSAVGLQLRVRFVPAALLAMLRTALALIFSRGTIYCLPHNRFLFH